MRFLVPALLSIGAFAPLAGAQGTPPPPSSAVLLTGRDLGLMAGATVGSAAISLLDARVANAFSDSAFHLRHPGFTSAAKRASVVTETALMITGGLVYGLARIQKDDGTADVAAHATISVASAAMAIQVVRGALGRARPHVINAEGETRHSDPYDFQLLHGFTSFDYRSYPSMHAMASFAVASALAQEMRRRDTPNRQVITPALYVGAAMPALARMYLDEHWTSDIAMGVFLGVFAGQKVVMYTHDHPDNRLDHALLKPQGSVTVSYGTGGLSFGFAPY
ncbi:MAG: phosphatase PAP2 family protein [Gemmatimonadota bacterium]|nr:phosphatase PAP2 family protein [Gemmatimonadota bacterium]